MSPAPKVLVNTLPLALTAILVITAVPVEFRAPVAWSLDFDPLDFLLNVVLFAPLGMGRWRRPMATSIVLGALLSIVIEVLQIWELGRFGAVFDVLANTLGVACGVLAGRWLARRYAFDPAMLPLGRWPAILAASGAALMVFAWILPGTASTMANWNKGYDVLLGNESTSDRPWRGRIAALAVLPGPLSRDEADALSDLGDPVVRAALLRRGAYLLPGPLDLDGAAAQRLPADVSQRFFELAVERNAFAVVVTITPADVEQSGPARVISYSSGVLERNFDLGQEGERLVFRIRTLVTDENGMDPHIETPPVLVADQPAAIVATFDGAVARVFVDGRAIGRLNLAAAGCAVAGLCDIGLPSAASLFGALLAILALYAAACFRFRGIAGSLVAVAAVGGAVTVKMLADDQGTFLSGWGAPVFVLIGAACVFLSVTAPGKGIERPTRVDPAAD